MFRFLLLFFYFAGSLAAQPVTAQAVIPADAKLKMFLEGLQTFTADFEQTLFNEFNEPLEKSTGTVYLQRPGKFRWVYTTPYSQYLISDGTDLWIYDQDLEQVTVSAIGNAIEKSPASLLAGNSEFGNDYIINDLGFLDGAQWVELAPSDPESQYHSIRIGFNNEQLVGMVLFDNLGQTTRIVFNNDKRNVDIDPSLFRFIPPEGADLIDNRAAINAQG